MRRVGVAGGVLSVAALTTAAAPSSTETTVEQPTNEVTQTLDLSQLRAAHATAQAAVNYELLATQDQSFNDALKVAQERKRAEEARIAAEKAAQQHAAAAKQDLQTHQGSTDSAPPSVSGSIPSSPSTASGSLQKRVLDFLQAQVGKSYILGGTGPYSYDCSGLVQAAFKTIHIDLPRTSQEQSLVGHSVSLSDLQPLDVLFWGGEGSAYHAAVYIGNGQFIGAQNPSEGIVQRPLTYSEPDYAIRLF